MTPAGKAPELITVAPFMAVKVPKTASPGASMHGLPASTTADPPSVTVAPPSRGGAPVEHRPLALQLFWALHTAQVAPLRPQAALVLAVVQTPAAEQQPLAQVNAVQVLAAL
jgi:hypothetical protein